MPPLYKYPAPKRQRNLPGIPAMNPGYSARGTEPRRREHDSQQGPQFRNVNEQVRPIPTPENVGGRELSSQESGLNRLSCKRSPVLEQTGKILPF
jgi:hypothetical protein